MSVTVPSQVCGEQANFIGNQTDMYSFTVVRGTCGPHSVVPSKCRSSWSQKDCSGSVGRVIVSRTWHIIGQDSTGLVVIIIGSTQIGSQHLSWVSCRGWGRALPMVTGYTECSKSQCVHLLVHYSDTPMLSWCLWCTKRVGFAARCSGLVSSCLSFFIEQQQAWT